MNVYPIALAAVVLANVILIGRRWARPWWKRRHTIVEWCEVCGKGLTRSSVRELRSEDRLSDRELKIGGDIAWGGTYMVATYCRRHFPK